MSRNITFRPNETDADIFFEQTNFVGLTSLGSVTWGIMFSIWVLSLNVLIPAIRRDNLRRDWFHIGYVTLMVVLAGVGNFCGLRVAQLSWIDDRNIPGGPNGFTVQYYNVLPNIVGDSAFTVAAWFQDGYQLYRLMVFWNFNYLIGIIPALMYLGSIAMGCVFLHFVSVPPDAAGGGTIFDPNSLASHALEAFYLLSVFENVLITLLIVGKVLWNQKAIRSVLGNQHAKMYTSIIAMLIESAALYSIVGIVFVGLFLSANPGLNLFFPILGGVGCIAPCLIIYRVASGRAWTREQMRKVSTGLGTLEFAPRKESASYSHQKSTNIPLTTLGSITEFSKGSTAFDKSYGSGKSGGSIPYSSSGTYA